MKDQRLETLIFCKIDNSWREVVYVLSLEKLEISYSAFRHDNSLYGRLLFFLKKVLCHVVVLLYRSSSVVMFSLWKFRAMPLMHHNFPPVNL